MTSSNRKMRHSISHEQTAPLSIRLLALRDAIRSQSAPLNCEDFKRIAEDNGFIVSFSFNDSEGWFKSRIKACGTNLEYPLARAAKAELLVRDADKSLYKLATYLN